MAWLDGVDEGVALGGEDEEMVDGVELRERKLACQIDRERDMSKVNVCSDSKGERCWADSCCILDT